jgi:hypothetical protein
MMNEPPAQEQQHGWPWMKGIIVPIAAPIDPVTTEDDRPAVLDLIEEKKQLIGAMREELKKDPLYSPMKHDDLWVLRFLLSHTKVKPAMKAAQHTLQFRKEHKLDEVDIRSQSLDKNSPNQALAKFRSHCDDDAGIFSIPDPRRNVVHYVRFAGIKQHAVVENLTSEECLEAYINFTEWSFQWLEYITRTTGRLTKLLRLIDLKGFKLSMLNSENISRDGKNMGTMEHCYPQALQAMYLCNAPLWIQIPWRTVRPIMPKRVVSKIDFIMPGKSEKERKPLYKFLTNDRLPTRFGGKHPAWPVPTFC